jgi:hypothetical protein
MMVGNAQRHQIVQCMGINLPRRPRHAMVNLKTISLTALNTLLAIAIKRQHSLALVMLRRVRIRVALPIGVAWNRAERTSLSRPVSLIRLSLERLLALNTRQGHPSRPVVISALPRAVTAGLIFSLASPKRDLAVIAGQVNRRHAHAPFTW